MTLLRRAVVPLMAATVLVLLPAAAQAAPQTYNVTKLTDSADGACNADCSLREAIIAANANAGHDTIVVPPGTYTLSLAPSGEGPAAQDDTQRDLDILEGVTITGGGGNRDADPNATVIQASATAGTALFRVFDVYLDNVAKPGADMDVRLEALTIRHGFQPTGTALHNGGGIQFYAFHGAGHLLIYNSIVTDNRAAADGGGISAANENQVGALLRIEKSAIINNSAGVVPTSGTDVGGSGGAVVVGDKLPVQIVDSRLANNTSRHGTASTGQGGAIYWWDDALVTNQSYIQNTIIDSNHAQGPTFAGGGGMYVGRSLTITNSTISNNIAEHDGGGLVTSSIDGHTLTIANTTISGNRAHNDGGGLYVSHGGTTGPIINLINLTISNNRADNDNAAGGNGGGLRRQTSPANGQIRLHNSIIARNFVGSSGTVADDMQGTGSLAATSSNNLVGNGGNGGLNPANSNLLGVADPKLAALTNNGSAALPTHVGLRLTHALLGDSPALDAGSSTYTGGGYGATLSTDARGTGWNRTLDAADAGIIAMVDIGALEMHPAIADTGNVTMLQDTSINNYTVHLGDADLGHDSVTADSSNASILPNPGISGAGATRTLALTPVAGQSGTVTVTLTTTDLYNGVIQTMSDTFTVTVVPRPNLTVTKSHTNPWQQADTGKTYTLTVSNLAGAGPTLAAGNAFGIDPTITVADTLPAGLTATAISGTGWSCTLGTLTCTRSDLLAAGSAYPVITVTVNVAENADPTVTNSVTVSGNADNTPGNNSATDPTAISQRADLTITKGHTGDFAQGQTGAGYTITVSNSGTGLTSGTVTVTDTLPDGLTPKTATAPADWACTISGQDVTCTTDGVKDHGQSYSPITITVDVAPLAPTTLTNTATVAGGSDTNPGNNSASDPTTIAQAPDLTIAKSHTGTFQRGQQGAAYTITVGNGGGLPTTGTVTVSDTMPTGVTPKGSSGSDWTCAISGQTYTCTTAAALAAGASYPAITLTVDVAVDAPSAIINTATVSGGGQVNTANDSATDAITIVAESDLTITKSHTGNLTQGQAATYTILVHNGGAGPTMGTATVTDTLPTGLSYVGATGPNWTCTATGQVVTCTSTDVVVAGSDYPALNLTVNVADSVPPTITNTADVSGGGELNTTNNTCLDEATVVQSVDLSIVKSHDRDFRQGQKAAAYSLTVTNNGIEASRGMITVVDTLPAGLVYAGFTGTDWTCTYDSATRTVTCTRTVALAPGAAAATIISITVDVADDAAPSVTNTAEVSGGGDHIPANNTATDVSTVIQVADLVIAKTLNGTLRQGRTAEYTLVVRNAGPGVTEGTVTVTDTMPTGMTVAGFTVENREWDCSFGAPSITCFRSDILAAGQPYSPIRVQVLVAADAPASLTNSAQVAGGGEVKLTNDTATHVANVSQVADLTLTKQHNGRFVRGMAGLYRLTVKNEGVGSTDAAVTVTDTLPAGMTATSLKGGGWSCDVRTVSCTRSDVLRPGGSYPPILLSVRVASNAEPNLVNQASVSGGGEARVNNNTASDPTQVVPRPPGGGGGDTPAPFVTITAPLEFTRESSVAVSGSANPGADIRVHGRSVRTDGDGTWSATVALIEGPNVITATNGSASDSVTVTRDTTAPPLTLTASHTRTEQAAVELTATSEEGARIEIEGRPTARLTVPLAIGDNTFSAKATDQAGNVTRATVTVVRVPGGSPPPPPGPPSPPPGPPIPPHRPFTDVDGHWARAAIARMVDQGVVRGYEDNTFRPEAPVSRLEFAVMVARLLTLTPVDQPLRFSDSASIPEWARTQMAAAVQAGIIIGRPDGRFDPNASVNRAEVAVMLVRAMKFRGIDVAPGTGRFADELPQWAREQVLSAARYGLVTGYQDGSFRAGNSATRAESVTMLDRLFTLLAH